MCKANRRSCKLTLDSLFFVQSLLRKIEVHERNLSKVEDLNYNLSLRRTELTGEQLKTYFKVVLATDAE